MSRRPLVLAVLVGALLVSGRAAAQDVFRALDLIMPSPAEPARPFTAPAMDGKTLSLAGYRGRVVFLNFWATWCVPCREEMPAMERLHQRFRDRGLVVLAVSVDAAPAPVGPFVSDLRLTYPIGLDPKMVLAKQYGVRGLPASFLITRTGTLAARALGPREWDSAAAHAVIETLLREGGG
jgi:peroxiredoxin